MSIYDAQNTNVSKRQSRKFRDIDLDFSRNIVTNDVNVVEDVTAIKRAVKNLVQTNFYERPFHPELGCGVRELLFEPFTPLTKIHLESQWIYTLGGPAGNLLFATWPHFSGSFILYVIRLFLFFCRVFFIFLNFLTFASKIEPATKKSNHI